MIGIIGAMQIEVDGIIAAMTETETRVLCGTPFTSGKLSGVPVTVARCGAGKVNAAMCAAVMIQSYAPKLIISTGVAGGIGEGVKIGDLVIATHAVQYDYDTTAIGEPKTASTGTSISFLKPSITPIVTASSGERISLPVRQMAIWRT